MAKQEGTYLHPSEIVRSAHAELLASARIVAGIDGHVSLKVMGQLNDAVVQAAKAYYFALYPPAEIEEVAGSAPA